MALEQLSMNYHTSLFNSMDQAGNSVRRSWTHEESVLYQQLTFRFGKDYKKYEEYFPQRTYNQIKSQFHNYKNKQEKQEQRSDLRVFVVSSYSREEATNSFETESTTTLLQDVMKYLV